MHHGPKESSETPREFYDFYKEQQDRARAPMELLHVESHDVVVKRWLKTRGTGMTTFWIFASLLVQLW